MKKIYEYEPTGKIEKDYNDIIKYEYNIIDPNTHKIIGSYYNLAPYKEIKKTIDK